MTKPDIGWDETGAPPCQGPDPQPKPPSFDIPSGACDAHAHVIGVPPAYPFVAARSYTPPEATEAAYLAMLDALHMARGVLVQVSVHGTDNRRMVEVVGRNKDRLRGIAVVAPDVPQAELEAMHEAGVRGIRLNVLFGGGVGLDAMETLAKRVAPLGWHIQFLLDARQLPEIAPRIAALPVPVVIDHMGHMPTKAGIDDPGFKAMLELVKGGRCWVKLSGAYRIADDVGHFGSAEDFARALVATRPDRMVWGSDWPHVAVSGRMPNTGELLDLLRAWVPDQDTRKRILVDNPAVLYGFR